MRTSTGVALLVAIVGVVGVIWWRPLPAAEGRLTACGNPPADGVYLPLVSDLATGRCADHEAGEARATVRRTLRIGSAAMVGLGVISLLALDVRRRRAARPLPLDPGLPRA